MITLFHMEMVEGSRVGISLVSPYTQKTFSGGQAIIGYWQVGRRKRENSQSGETKASRLLVPIK
jgi:hypothetical protein